MGSGAWLPELLMHRSVMLEGPKAVYYFSDLRSVRPGEVQVTPPPNLVCRLTRK